MRRARACRRADLLLPDYLTGRLGSRETRFLQTHLAGCDRCRGELLVLRRLVPTLAKWRAMPAPAGFERRVMAAIAARPAWQEAAILGGLTAAALAGALFILLVMPIAAITVPRVLILFASLAAWAIVSAGAAFAVVWAADYPAKEVRSWGMAAVARGPFSPGPLSEVWQHP